MQSDKIEEAAKRIFAVIPFAGPAGAVRPVWVEGGNSEKQDEARRYAVAAIGGETPAPQADVQGLTDEQVEAVTQLVERRLCIIWSKVGAREAFVNELRVLEPVAEEDEAECCVACDVPFEEGDLVYWCSDDTGHLHADCCGPERESYVNADGSPLMDGEAIPAPFRWKPDRATTEGPADV